MAATLEEIRKKVRRLTRSPSEAQLSNDNIDEYVNTFLLYDFPEILRLFTFRKTLTFYTQPDVAEYKTNAVNPSDPLYNFKNAFITSHDPVYIAGYKAYFTHSRNEFFNLFPTVQGRHRIGTGDGIVMTFTGTLSAAPVLSKNVLFSSIDEFGGGLSIYDSCGDGDGDLYGDVGLPSSINYLTGEYEITYSSPPGPQEPIYAQTVQYKASRPNTMLYFDNTFTLRPVPDMPYAVSLETYVRPTALIDAGDEPELEQHWQYIALGAARKVLQDRLDIDTLALIEPEFKEQELLTQRRTIVQQADERVATIYTSQLGANRNNWNNFF